MLSTLILIGGILHFGTLIASALVPRVLDWGDELAKLSRLSQQVIWVHGAFIVLTILGLGSVSVFFSTELASGSPLARAVCGYIAIFWGFRLLIQFFYFDAKPLLNTTFLTLGYHALTCVFLYHTVVMGFAALT